MSVEKISKDPEKQLPVQVFQELDRLDENQSLNDLKREEFLNELVYDTVIEGRKVTSLSITGVREAGRRRGKYTITDFRVDDDKDQFRCTIKMHDDIQQIDVLGAAVCEKSKPFAYTLCINKAERNCLRKLLPEKLIAEMIKEFLERKKPRPVTTQPVSAKEAESAKPIEIEIKLSKEAPGTKTQSNSPTRSPINRENTEKATSAGQFEEVAGTTPHWKVPTSSKQLTPDLVKQGVSQVFLADGLLSIGAINRLNDEIAIVPEQPIPDSAPIGWFKRDVLEKMKAKHGITYELRTENGLLSAILIRGKLTEDSIKDLRSGAKWAFQTASEPPAKLDRSRLGSPLR